MYLGHVHVWQEPTGHFKQGLVYTLRDFPSLHTMGQPERLPQLTAARKPYLLS